MSSSSSSSSSSKAASRGAGGIEHDCSNCAVRGAEVSALCAQCQMTWYCNRDCQKAHWKVHKKTCAPIDQPPAKAKAKAPAAKPTSAADDSIAAALATAKPARSKAASSSSSSSSAPVALNPITFSLPSSVAPSHPLVEVRDIPGKGRGFVAREAIAPGTLLLTEESIYAHSEGVNSNEEQRLATLAALTKCMFDHFPEALALLCHHADHELPEHAAIDTPPAGLTVEQWHDALARVDSNQFTSHRSMMVSPTVSMCNHSCWPVADLIIREVPSSTQGASVEQASVYAIQEIAAGAEITINYLGQDSLCRWYAPSMIRQESFKSQWQFECDCSRCVGSKAKAIDQALSYTPGGLDEELDLRYTQLVLAENTTDPHKLLQLYRDMFTQLHGAQHHHHYLLHQLRMLLIFMPAAFVNGEAEWLQLVEHHVQAVKGMLNPPLHSIKSDSIMVILRSSDFIGKFASINANKSGADVVEHAELRRKIVAICDDYDECYLDTPVFAQLYPETHAAMSKYAPAATE